MFEQFIKDVKAWAIQDKHIECILLVGSYARGTQKNTSDIDLCILTTNKKQMVETQDFPTLFGTIKKLQTEYYGACTSIRVWYQSGLEVEFGLVDPTWIMTPLDEGTSKVLQDGYRVIIDKNNYLHTDKS